MHTCTISAKRNVFIFNGSYVGESMQRISTNQLFNSVTNRVNKLYTEVGRLAEKRGAKQPYDSFKELGTRGNISTVIESNQLYSEYQSYLTSANNASMKLDAIIESMQRIFDTSAEMLTDLSIERTDVLAQGPKTLKSSISSKLFEIQTALNSSSMGYYVFSGSKTNFKPVQDISTPNFKEVLSPASFSKETITTHYYTGNSDIASVVLDKGLVVDYGVTANNEVFAKLIASAHTAMSYGEVPENLVHGQKMLEETLQDLNELIQTAKYRKNLVDKYSNRYNDLFLELSEIQNKIDESNGMDTLSIVLKATNTETALSASQYMLIQMEQMSIMHFLK